MQQAPRRSARIASQKTSQIIEIQHISEVLDYIGEGTAFAWDVDNTLYEPFESCFPGDIWFDAQLKEYLSEGLDIQEALAKTLPLYIAAQHKTKVKVCEPEVIDVIASLQAFGFQNFALTSRGDEILRPTLEQLASVGIDFNHGKFKNKTVMVDEAKHRQAHQGVIFCAGGTSKGMCFQKVIEGLRYRPSRLVFIDDKQEYLEAVKPVCEALGIQFIGLRYAYMDARKAQFNEHILNLQKEVFEHPFLSDDEASLLLQFRNQPKLGLVPNFGKKEMLIWCPGNQKALYDKICGLSDKMIKSKTDASTDKPFRRTAKYHKVAGQDTELLCSRFKVPFSDMLKLLPKMVKAGIINQALADSHYAQISEYLEALQSRQLQTPQFELYRSRLRPRASTASAHDHAVSELRATQNRL